MVDENTNKFGEQTIGIHGQELPKYRGTSQQKWWEQSPRGSPAITSQIHLKQEHKYWANNDKMLLADVSPQPGPEDPFKSNRVFGEGQKVLPEKVTLTNHWRNEDLRTEFSPLKNHKHKKKWSDYMDQFNGSERFLAGVISKAQAEEKDCERRE